MTEHKKKKKKYGNTLHQGALWEVQEDLQQFRDTGTFQKQ